MLQFHVLVRVLLRCSVGTGLLMLLLGLVGCRSSGVSPGGAPAGLSSKWQAQLITAKPTRIPSLKPGTLIAPKPATGTIPNKELSHKPVPTLLPVTECKGVVLLVNTQGQFIVADFSFNQIPKPGQRLVLYRDGQRVGEARTSSFIRGSLVAADILSGEAKVNDEIRAE